MLIFFKLIGLLVKLLQHALQVASLLYLAFSSVYMKSVFLKGGEQFCPRLLAEVLEVFYPAEQAAGRLSTPP